MESVGSEIVQPERMSVSELREWLARFGEKNREHYQKNKPERQSESYGIRQRMEGVRRKIEHFEESSGQSTLGNSSQESHETQPAPEQKEVDSSTQSENVPFFRDFDKESPPTFHPAARARLNGKSLNSSSTDIDGFRIVSIRKLLDPPKPHRRGQSFSSWEDVSNPIADTSWHPNAARRTSLLDDTITASSDNDDADTLDTVSIGTGRFTDPGTSPRLHCLSRRLVRRLKKGGKDDYGDDGGVGEKSGSKLRRKIPLFLCKSAKDKEAERPFLYKTLAVQDVAFEDPEDTAAEPNEVVLQATRESRGTEMHNASILQGHMLTSDTLDLLCSGRVDPNKYQRPSAIVEDTTESSWSEDSGVPSIAPNAIDAKLGDIFAEEDHKDTDKTTYTRMDFEQEMPMTFTDHREEPPTSPERESPNAQPSVKSSSGWTSPELKAEDSQDSSSSSRVNQTVQKFGGSAKKSAIQRRKEELERQWAAQREPSHVKKVKWHVCRHTGTYKKKVILDFADE